MTMDDTAGPVTTSAADTHSHLSNSTKRPADSLPANEPQAKKLALVGILPDLPAVDQTQRHQAHNGDHPPTYSIKSVSETPCGPSSTLDVAQEPRHEAINNIDHAFMDPYAMPVLQSPSSALRSSLSCNQGVSISTVQGIAAGTSTHSSSAQPTSTSNAQSPGAEPAQLSDARARLAAASYASPQPIHATTHANATQSAYQPHLPPIYEHYTGSVINAYSRSPHLPTMPVSTAPSAYSQTQQYPSAPSAYRFFDSVHLQPLPAPIRPLSKTAISPYSSQLYDPRIDVHKAYAAQPVREATLARGSMYHPAMYHAKIGLGSPPVSLRSVTSGSTPTLPSPMEQSMGRRDLSVTFSPGVYHQDRGSSYAGYHAHNTSHQHAHSDYALHDLQFQQAYNSLHGKYSAAAVKTVQLRDSGFDGTTDLPPLPLAAPVDIQSAQSEPPAAGLNPSSTSASLTASIPSSSDSTATTKKGKKTSKKATKQVASLPVGTIALDTIATSKGVNIAQCTRLKVSYVGTTHEPEYHIWDWTEAEVNAARRLIRFTGVSNEQNGTVIFSTQVLQPGDYNHVTETSPDTQKGAVVSCIFKDGLDSFRDESGQHPIYYVTHFDILRIIGAVFRDHGTEFPYDWRAKIRSQKLAKTRNISVDKPAPHLATTVFTEFASQIVAYPEPRPRDIIRGMKAVPWEDLSGILKDILSRFIIVR